MYPTKSSNFQVRRSFEVPDDIIENLWASGYIVGYNYDGRYIWKAVDEYESEKVYLLFSYHSYGERSVLFVEGPRAAVDRVCSLLVEKDFVSAKRYKSTAEESGYRVKS